MAWNTQSAPRFSGKESASGNALTLGLDATGSLLSGGEMLVAIAANNTTSGDGQTSLVTSVTDSVGNTYTKIVEYTNGQTAAAAGATVSLWKSSVTATVGQVGTTITVNFGASIAARAAYAKGFTKTAGNTVSISAIVTNSTDAASPTAQTITGLDSAEYLFVHATAHEGDVADDLGVATSYVAFSNNTGSMVSHMAGTTGGGGAGNMAVHAEWRINTATFGTTDGHTDTAADHAQVFVALREKAASQVGTATLTFSQDATLKGDGALVAQTNQGLTFGQAASLTGSGALVAAANQGITFGQDASLGAFAFGVGTGTLTFAENATLSATGALTATDGFVFAQNATLAATGALVGAASITFSQDATLKGDQPIVGAASIAFGQDATLTGSGALVGAGAITFGENATLSTAASEALVGSADLVFAQNATLTGAGALVGAASLTFNQDATLKGDLPFVASAAIIFGQNATLAGSGALVGAGTITFGQDATMSGAGALVGAGTVTFGQDATFTGAGALSGTATTTFGQNATLTGAGALAGTATVTFGQDATLGVSASGAMVGSASVTFGQNAILLGDFGLAAIATLIFGSDATLNRPAESEEGTNRPRPDDGPGRSIYKPTGLLHRKPKLTARKEVADRVEESREIAEEVSAQVAREFAEENAVLKPISQMSQAEIAAEIAARLRPLANVQSIAISQDDEMLVLMMAGI